MGRHEDWCYCEGHTLYHPCWPIDPNCKADNIDDFVLNCAKLNGFLNNVYKDFTRNINFIGDYENLIDDLFEIFKKIGIKIRKDELANLTRKNESPVKYKMREDTMRIINNVESEYYDLKFGL
jgi:hypothetical protein